MTQTIYPDRHPQAIQADKHPSTLFILFFTEMWERFSYYGMRALLVLFLTSSLMDGGWGWERAEALRLYGVYTGFVYLTPIIGGFIADKFLGYRNAIILGALSMTLGHASMAAETPFFFYAGLLLIIIGNGLFKPNISSMVGQLYTNNEDKKDAAYTIFYMGINSGAFLGILLCGYIGEKVGWSYGFGLAGIFMFFGML
jgi:POT family proton-dependent oligopeptide transporter